MLLFSHSIFLIAPDGRDAEDLSVEPTSSRQIIITYDYPATHLAAVHDAS